MVKPLLRDNEIAVVTGGGGGIGRALVAALATRNARCICVVDRDAVAAEAAATAIGDRAVSFCLNVSDPPEVADFVAQVERDHGPIGCWFSNAGVHRGDGLGDLADWRGTLDVNLLAHVHAARQVVPLLEVRGRGCFVITASAAGLLSDLRSAPYSASKHAAIGLAEWLAIGVGEGVSIHCVCPEGVLTGMTRSDSVRAAQGMGFIQPDEVAEATLAGIARGDFLILTHPRTSEFEQRRITDRPRWIAGMRKARKAALGRDRLFSLPAEG